MVVSEKTIRYVSAALLLVTLGASFNRGYKLTTQIQEETETKTTLNETVRQLSLELERVTKELDMKSTSNTEVDVVETVTEDKVTGKVVTERRTKSKTKTDTESKTKEVVEKKKETEETKDTKVTVEEKKKRVEVTVKESPSSGRLGLDVGFGLGVSRDLSWQWEVDVSYEVRERVAPRLGVEFNPTFTRVEKVKFGVELKL